MPLANSLPQDQRTIVPNIGICIQNMRIYILFISLLLQSNCSLYPHTWRKHPLVYKIIQHVEYSVKMARVNKLKLFKRRRTPGELAYANIHECIFA